MLRPNSLRARLVLGVIVLAALGLAIADVATYASLRSFLFHRTDSTLQAAHPIVEGNVFGSGQRDETGPGPGPAGLGPPGAVLAALAALGLWVVRLGLRPLRAIEGTAASYAAGDLSQRVEHADRRTEVGRLGLALNAMLGQIESAFKAREASEQKLRRFVADASHELRTPLAAVRAYAELFSRGADRRPEDLARSMSGISRESERMSMR